jgi:hypothetical protein
MDLFIANLAGLEPAQLTKKKQLKYGTEQWESETSGSKPEGFDINNRQSVMPERKKR